MGLLRTPVCPQNPKMPIFELNRVEYQISSSQGEEGMWQNILSNRAELDISVFRTDATFRITWVELDSSPPLLKP